VQLKSMWFQLEVNIQSEGIELESHALIDARTAPVLVTSRSWGEAG
jgi:hypothetical protein